MQLFRKDKRAKMIPSIPTACMTEARCGKRRVKLLVGSMGVVEFEKDTPIRTHLFSAMRGVAATRSRLQISMAGSQLWQYSVREGVSESVLCWVQSAVMESEFNRKIQFVHYAVESPTAAEAAAAFDAQWKKTKKPKSPKSLAAERALMKRKLDGARDSMEKDEFNKAMGSVDFNACSPDASICTSSVSADDRCGAAWAAEEAEEAEECERERSSTAAPQRRARESGAGANLKRRDRHTSFGEDRTTNNVVKDSGDEHTSPKESWPDTFGEVANEGRPTILNFIQGTSSTSPRVEHMDQHESTPKSPVWGGG